MNYFSRLKLYLYYLFDPDPESDTDPELLWTRYWCRDRHRYRYQFFVPESRSVRTAGKNGGVLKSTISYDILKPVPSGAKAQRARERETGRQPARCVMSGTGSTPYQPPLGPGAVDG